MKALRIASLLALLVSAFVSLDLLLNLLGSLIPEMNDGLGFFGLTNAQLYFGDSGWSRELYFDAFYLSVVITFLLGLENTVLAILAIRRR